jgi:hypothetical protein
MPVKSAQSWNEKQEVEREVFVSRLKREAIQREIGRSRLATMPRGPRSTCPPAAARR